MNDFSLHHSLLQAGQQSALASGTTNRALGAAGVPGWLGNTGLNASGLPWFAQHAHREQPQPALPFQIPDFIKHAAQQHLAAQQVAQLKLRNEHAMANYSSSSLSKEKSKRELSEGDTPNGKKRRGNYASYTPQQRIEIGVFSIEYGTGRASKQFGLPESTARGFRDKLIKMLQDGNENLPIEKERLKRLKTLLESGHDTSVNHEVPTSVSQMSLPAWHPTSHPSTDQSFLPNSVPLVKPMFQPQLDLINKSANEVEEELNVTKSSFGEVGVAKIEEISNSDEDSGNSSANSSANDDAKKNLQFQMLGDNHPFYMMRNHLIQSFNKANSEALNIKSVSRKRTATDSTLSSTHSEAKIPRKQNDRQDMTTSSPQENKNKALRAALYDQSNVGESTEAILQAADNNIEMAKAGGEAGLEGTVRLKGQVEITSPPSDISSIDGHEERNCHTPNSLSSNENKENNLEEPINASDSRSEFSQKISRDISHGEAGQILSQVESALDKVTGPMEEVKLSSFTGRLLGILTRTVKYVTDCENRLMQESATRMKLTSKVEEQEQLINALSSELMRFEQSQQKLQQQVDQLQQQKTDNRSDPVIDGMNHLVSALRKPGQLDELKQSSEIRTINLNQMTGSQSSVVGGDLTGSLADMIDALGDKMSHK